MAKDNFTEREQYLYAIIGGCIVLTLLSLPIAVGITIAEGRPILNKTLLVPLGFAGVTVLFLLRT